MPRIDVDGVSLSYEERGQGAPLLLLHAYPLSRRMFRPQLEGLSDRFRVIAPDLRGFGDSDLGTGPTEMSRLAKDALALLDALKIDTAIVGGVSMGGYAAMAVLRENPGRVSGLVLADTQALADDDAGKARREQQAQAVIQDGMPVLVDAMLSKLVAPSAPAALRAEVEAMIRSNRPEGAAAAARGMALRHDSREVLARFSGPAVVLVGEHDGFTPPEKAKQIADLISGARLVTLAGAGHLSNLEAPDAFNRAVGQLATASPRG